MIISDNGKQFKCTQFNKSLDERSIKHVYTAIYSPQANARESVNRSTIAAIRTYVSKEQTNWDRYIPEIAEYLRSSYHQTIGFSPYYSLFGQQMITNANDYPLINKLESFEDETMSANDKLKLIRDTIANNITKSFEASSKRYNLRSLGVTFNIGDEVYRRNFVKSDASKKFCYKFAPLFVRSKVIGLKGNNIYQLEDVDTGRREFYHKKDIQKRVI